MESAIASVLILAEATSAARSILIRLGIPGMMMFGSDCPMGSGESFAGGGDLFDDEDGRSSACWESGEVLFVVLLLLLVCIVELFVD